MAPYEPPPPPLKTLNRQLQLQILCSTESHTDEGRQYLQSWCPHQRTPPPRRKGRLDTRDDCAQFEPDYHSTPSASAKTMKRLYLLPAPLDYVRLLVYLQSHRWW